MEDCPRDDEVGPWERAQIKWDGKSPKLLPSDGIGTIRRLRKPKPHPRTPVRDQEGPVELPPVTIKSVP